MKKSLWYFGLVVALLLTGWGLFDYGRDRAGFDSEQASVERDGLIERIEQLQQTNEQLRAQKAIHEQAREIDRVAYDKIDDSLAELQSEVLELKEEVIFYRGIVGSSDQVRGLQVLSFLLEDNGDKKLNYRYRLILNQLEKSNRVIKGRVRLTLIGLLGDKQVELLHAEIAKKATKGEKFRFKYFQEIDGDIVLPEGFVPLRIKVRASSDGKKPKLIERVYSWSELMD